MRSRTAAAVLLVALGLVPVAAWLAMAGTLEPAGLGRSLGKAVLVLMAPLAIAGLLMIVGGALLARLWGRIAATLGAAVNLAGAVLLSLWWARQLSSCSDAEQWCLDGLVEGAAGLLYALASAAAIALVWRAQEPAADSNGASTA